MYGYEDVSLDSIIEGRITNDMTVTCTHLLRLLKNLGLQED